MRKLLLLSLLCIASTAALFAQNVPEILYYKFDGAGTSVPNMASNPPAGTATGTIIGAHTQGGVGLCGGALIGPGLSSTSNYLSTGWNTALGTSAWTIMFWTNDIPNNTTLHYQFGDGSAGSFRCFNNGVAGPGNWMLRGPVTDVTCTGCAPVGNVPSMTAFVYDPIAGNIKAYYNGVLNNTVAQGALNITGADFKVGGYASSTGMGANQLMDEFRFYNRAVDANEVLLVYNQCLPLSSSPNDAGLPTFVGPQDFCPDTLDIQVVVKNFGTQQLDSCMINWTFNGAPRPSFAYYGPLDTLNGLGSDIDTITLGTEYFAAGIPYTIEAWTTMPNGVADTVNFNDTIVRTLQASLSGTYVIGGPGADYPNFSAAVSDLNAYGLCGPVVFNVYDSLYIEQFDMGTINGASAVNTILFQPISGRPTVQFNGTGTADNYVVKMSGADYVTFDGLLFTNQSTAGFSRVVEFTGGSDYNTFMNCNLIGELAPTTTSTFIAVLISTGGVDNYNTFTNDSIMGGSYGVYWYGGGTTTLEDGNVFEGNTFKDAYYQGTRLYYQSNTTFKHNTVSSNTSYTGTGYGIYFGYCDSAYVFTHNKLESSSRWPIYGMYLLQCDGTSGGEGLVANNFVHIGSGQNATFYGLYNTGSTYIRYYNNNIHLDDIGTSSRAFYVTSGNDVDSKNNIFVSNLGYAAYFSSTTAVNSSDHNDYFSNGTNLAYYGGAIANLAALQTASSMEANSVSVDPMFYSADDLHTCNMALNDAGTPVPGVTDDIDGDMRNALTPDIGADEMLSLAAGFLGADTTVCANDTVWFTVGSPSDTVVWSNGAVGNTVMLTMPGVYTVTVTTPCATGTDTVELIASNLVYSGYVGADTTSACEGDTINLYSNDPYDTYAWSTGATTQGIAVTASGTYVLDVTDGCGTGSDSIIVAFSPAPVVSAGADQDVCDGDMVTLSGSGANTYIWDQGVIDGQAFTATGTVTYTVIGVDANGCEGSDNVTVTATVADATVTVNGGMMSVPNAPGSTYQWVDCNNSNAPVPGATNFEFFPAVSGNYACQVTNGGCIVTGPCQTVVAVEAELPGFSLNVTPNPANNFVTIGAEVEVAAALRISLVNPIGQVVYSTDLEVNAGTMRHEIKVSDFTAGVYFLRFEVDGKSAIRRLMIAH